jgi:hypothetical protein
VTESQDSGQHRTGKNRLFDFIDIFLEPSAVLGRHPRASIALPLCVLIAGSVASYYAFISILEPAYWADFQYGVARQSLGGKFTSAQLGDAFATNVRLGGAFFVVTVPLTVICIACSIWMASSLWDARIRFEQALLIATWAYFPRLIQAVSTPMLALFKPATQVDGMGSLSAGVTFFVSRESVPELVYQLLLRVDIFTAWVTVLIVLGLRMLKGSPLSLSGSIVVGSLIYALGSIPSISAALR